jgi:protein-ribulosamine 3-kinase
MTSDATSAMTDAVRAALAAAFGSAVSNVHSVAGGCISPSWRTSFADGGTAFVKTVPAGAGDALLAAEALSLARLAATEAVRVPAVLAAGAGWLALEWLEPAAAGREQWEELGTRLARLHRTTGPAPGWDSDNFIGSLPQANTPSAGWAEFWAERRLGPQFERAAALLPPDTRRDGVRLLHEMGDRLAAAEGEGTSLLHGDLWSGNVHMSTSGPALVDPSCYYGHREVDLAMSRLFGGFDAGFYRAYEQEWPLLPGAEARLPLYQLYYLLVHVNLFGAGYVAGTRRALADALAAG